MSLNVQLPKFEGPLGLLLYLIRKEEMDIMDIRIHDITRQYLEYIKLMKELDLEVAGEFISMASTLIHIKSKMLLPQYNEHGEVIEQEDPRKELVQKLLEYQKYQEAAKLLYERPLIGRDVFVRGQKESLQAQNDEILLEENALFSLISSYRRVVRQMKKKVHQVSKKAQSISSRILEIKDQLVVGKKIVMMDLVTATEDRSRQALITFLSILELGKMGIVSLFQTETYSDIYVEARRQIESDMISRVEEYDSMNAEEVAQKIIEKNKKDEELLKSLEQDQIELADSDTEEASTQGLLASEILSGDSFQLDAGNISEQVSVELTDDMASDDDILQAELELEKENENASI